MENYLSFSETWRKKNTKSGDLPLATICYYVWSSYLFKSNPMVFLMSGPQL